jgi:hypothetical protein
MSSFAISSILPVSGARSTSTVATGPAQPQPAPQVATPQEDTVQLSVTAQAQAMYQSGESVSSIASSLGTSVSLVDSYLGIATTIAVPTSVGGHGSHAASAAPAKTTAPDAPAPAAKTAAKS